MKLYLPEKVNQIIHTLQANGYEAYAVGGCVRDALLGLTPHDYDLCTDALPTQIRELFAMLMSCRSASSPSSWKIFSIRPLSDHSLNRLYTVEYGPYRSGRSHQAAPLRAIQKMPFSISLGSRLGRPLSPICRSGK